VGCQRERREPDERRAAAEHHQVLCRPRTDGAQHPGSAAPEENEQRLVREKRQAGRDGQPDGGEAWRARRERRDERSRAGSTPHARAATESVETWFDH